ncbi:MAG: hypothetical protein JSS42_08725 [Proteobacteria bacterium]|nr:hypothetical protein [Pseudomonadota bacterium]
MNISNLFLAAALVAANAGAAQSGATLAPVAVRGERIVVECADRRSPSFAAVADLIDSNNITLIHASRERLLHTAQRLCLRGAGYVAFVHDKDPAVPALAVVEP